MLFDNLNILTNSCYSENELDFIEIMNEIISLCEKDPAVSIALGINRDLFDEKNDISLTFYRDYKNTSFDYVFELNRNLAGYSRDVHG